MSLANRPPVLTALRVAGEPSSAAPPESVPGRPGVFRIQGSTTPGAAGSARFEALQTASRRLGFVRLGVSGAGDLTEDSARLQAWLGREYEGDMAYLRTPERGSPRSLLPEARSLVVVALPCPLPIEEGPVASYAQGADYHRVIKGKLLALAQVCADLCGGALLARPCVDTAPLLERAAAARAGVGFQGKSTLTIVPGVGTRVLLGELLLDVELPLSAPGGGSGCGECTRCLDACPTQAFVGPHVLDARRCISYLTIEFGGSIPEALRPGIGERVFGCDVCQSVCPFNSSRKLPPSAEELKAQGTPFPALEELLTMGSGRYRRLVANSALSRVSRIRLQRNAAIALGNRRDPASVDLLGQTLLTHPHPLVREHVAWALGQFGTEAAREFLQQALACEGDAVVLQALAGALGPEEELASASGDT